MSISKEMLEGFEKRYNDNPANAASESAISRVGIQEASFNNDALRKHNFVFSDKVKKGKVTYQKMSGRCWMFASLNTARIDTMKKLNMKTLEFSQNYTFFWDKLERSNYFLESIIETLDEKTTSQVVIYLLKEPLQDGGQWDMFSGIIKKYGIVPKDHMPETFHSSNSHFLNITLNSRLRFYAKEMRKMHQDGKSIDEIIQFKDEMLYNIYNVLVKALGKVPKVVNFEYLDKDENFHRLPSMSPTDFFKEVVGWNLEDRVSLINAPTSDKPFGKAYTVEHLGTVKEGKAIKHINMPIEDLKKAAIKSLKNNDAVWFGCDVGKMLAGKEGIMDSEMFKFDDTLGNMPAWSKGDRLEFRESELTHAMVITAVDLDDDGNVIKWEVENSWGKDVGNKGDYSMDDKWFDEFVYQIMVDKKYMDEKYLSVLDDEVIALKPWDPIGALAL